MVSSIGNWRPANLPSDLASSRRFVSPCSSSPLRFFAGLSRSHASNPRPDFLRDSLARSAASISSWCHCISSAYLSLSALAIASYSAFCSSVATFHRSATSRPISVNDSAPPASCCTSTRATLEKYMNALCAAFGPLASLSPFLILLPSSLLMGFGFDRLHASAGDSISLSKVAGAFRCLLFGSASATDAGCAACSSSCSTVASSPPSS
mmetsp:Transcript_72225/g.160576  ORF Transcript_72225/g.160576 Transcript_72225/m.160576 type:complete len:209 (+) Transcript_72225:312-938(+)